MGDSIHDIITSVFHEAGIYNVNAAQVISDAGNIRIKKKDVSARILNENGTAYIGFVYKGEYYKTVLRGKFQAWNAAFCIEIFRKMNIAREYIDRGLISIPLDGRFETIIKKPLVIFDAVSCAESMKHFVENVDDYFGRAAQKALITQQNLHPKPFKRLIICDYFSPALARIKQNVTIIFTREQLQKEYLATYNGVVKTMVMEFEKALQFSVENFPEHKIFIVASYDFLERTRKILCID